MIRIRRHVQICNCNSAIWKIRFRYFLHIFLLHQLILLMTNNFDSFEAIVWLWCSWKHINWTVFFTQIYEFWIVFTNSTSHQWIYRRNTLKIWENSIYFVLLNVGEYVENIFNRVGTGKKLLRSLWFPLGPSGEFYQGKWVSSFLSQIPGRGRFQRG